MALDPGSRRGGGDPSPTVAGRGESELSARINVTPMIDVMLVLLIIFMVVTPLIAEYEATPPRALTAEAAPDADVITLAIDREGRYFLENEPVAAGELERRLEASYAAQQADELLMLEADRAVDYARILHAMEAARAVGVETIGAVTRPEEAAEEGAEEAEDPDDRTDTGTEAS